jgi:hypothetical protein
VRCTAGGQRQRRDTEQNDKEDREALLLEHLDEAGDGFLTVAFEPALELMADRPGALRR